MFSLQTANPHFSLPIMHIKFVRVGKTRNEPIRSLVSDYFDRLRHLVSCEVIEAPDIAKKRSLTGETRLAAEAAAISKHLTGRGLTVVLDEGGKQKTSVEFAAWLQAEQNRGGREITFIIGGPEGISPVLCAQAQMSFSLGKMTWTHEMCRALLVEQVYRALCILRNIPYHK